MKVPLLSGRQVLAAALQRLGFVEIHRKGSHVKTEHQDGRRIVLPFTPRLTGTPSRALFAMLRSNLKNSCGRSNEPRQADA